MLWIWSWLIHLTAEYERRNPDWKPLEDGLNMEFAIIGACVVLIAVTGFYFYCQSYNSAVDSIKTKRTTSAHLNMMALQPELEVEELVNGTRLSLQPDCQGHSVVWGETGVASC